METEKTLEAIVASPPEREHLVIQVFLKGGGQIAEIIYEGGRFTLELYPQASRDPWVLDLEELERVFSLSKQELLKRLG
jgi:hypothetical protein